VAVSLLLVLLAAAGGVWALRGGHLLHPQDAMRLEVRVEGRLERVQLVAVEGGHRFLVRHPDGDRPITPEEFAAALLEGRGRRDWLASLFNISSPIGMAWIAVGLLGQLLFTGRMVIQWLHSERHGRSLVPPIFWWMSLGGALMLLVYFLWRGDLVGVLGQSLGFVIYMRNLVLLGAEPVPEALE
jgi:lipid-A-disaccharide synthase-like uncharacterized protein